MKLKALFSVLPIVLLVNSGCSTGKIPKSWVVDKLLDDYDREEPPRQNQATEVRVRVGLNSFQLSESDMSCSIGLHLRLFWQDPRLQFDSDDGRVVKLKSETIESISGCLTLNSGKFHTTMNLFQTPLQSIDISILASCIQSSVLSLIAAIEVLRH